MKDFKLKIEWVNIKELKPYENNAKKHSKDQIHRLAKNIEATGFDVPILVDKEKVIIAGHGRFLAVQEAGLTELPIIIRHDLSQDEINAKRISDNTLVSLEYEQNILLKELEDLTLKGLSLVNLGITDKELQALRNEVDKDLIKNKKHLEKEKEFEAKSELIISILCRDEEELKAMFSEMTDRGFQIKLFA